MTEENTEEVDLTEEVENYDYPEYRESGEREFLEGEVGAFVEDGEQAGDCLEYDGYFVPAEAVHALSEHDYHSRVQLSTVEYEDDTDKCDVCGEEFKSVEQHQTLSECGDE